MDEQEAAEEAYSRILVPTDGSDLAVRAMEEALTVAAVVGASIHVLYVVDDTTVAELAAGSGMDDLSFEGDTRQILDRFEGVAERAVEELRAVAAGRDVEVTPAVRTGIPHEEIIDYARGNGIDLIVMGTHGRRGIQRYVLGSTTERVLRETPVPVLAVRADGE